MADPSAFFDVASTALECICNQMDSIAADDEEYAGCPCLAYVSAGAPDIDCCTVDCGPGGMLTVHLENVYPSDSFPLQAGSFEPCKPASWAATLVVTAARCTPPMDDQGHPPTVEALSDVARTQAIDAWAILQALGCCLVADAFGSKRRRRVVITGMRPLATDTCSSIEVRAAVEIAQICGCPEAVS